MKSEDNLTDKEISEIALINKLNSGKCSPLEIFNIKMYFGINNDSEALRHIMDEEKWQSDLIKNKLENDKFNEKNHI